MMTKTTTEDLKTSKEQIAIKFYEQFGYAPPPILIKSMTFQLTKGMIFLINKRIRQATNEKKLNTIRMTKKCIDTFKISENHKEFWQENAQYFMQEIEPNKKWITQNVCYRFDRHKGLIAGTTFNLMEKYEYKNTQKNI